MEKNRYFIKQIHYDLATGFRQNILILAVYFVGTIIFSQVQLHEFMDMNLGISWGSSIGAMFKGIKELSEMGQEFNSFRIPIEWLWFHICYLIGIAAYPMHDYDERGYQFLIRAGSKKIWWISKCVWVIVYCAASYLVFWLGIGVSDIISMNSFSLRDDTYFGTVYNYMAHGQLYYIIFAMPALVMAATAMMELMLVFMKNEIVAVIIVFSYIVMSAYIKNPLLIENYIMISRYDFSNIGRELIVGTIICLVFTVMSVILGYLNFKRIEWGNRKCT